MTGAQMPIDPDGYTTVAVKCRTCGNLHTRDVCPLCLLMQRVRELDARLRAIEATP